MKLTPGQLDQIGELSDLWSFLWDKRRSVWIAAEDCPDGEQVEDADLDTLLAVLHRPEIMTVDQNFPPRGSSDPRSRGLSATGTAGPVGVRCGSGFAS